jgi:DNA replication and repair protein RecF
MLQLGSYLTSIRLHLLAELYPILHELAATHFGEDFKDLELNYLCKLLPGNFKKISAAREETATLQADIIAIYADKLATGRDKEINSKQSQYGPHKDDFEVILNGNDLKIFGSRGQQRIATFLIKLAMWQYLAAQKGTSPIILLDDIMSELDGQNRKILEEMILGSGAQTFITTTHATDYGKDFRSKSEVKNLSDLLI